MEKFAEEKIRHDTTIYIGKEFEYEVKRIYKRSNYFVEQNLFSGKKSLDKGTSDTFQIKNGVWFLLNNGKWEYFFSSKGFAKKQKAMVKIAMQDYYLIPDKKTYVNGKLFYELNATPTLKKIKVSSRTTFVFDPAVGIIKIITPYATLKRIRVKTVDKTIP